MLVLASLIAFALSVVSIGILAGPMYAGMILIALKIHRGEPTEAKDIFQGFDYFLPAFLFTLVWGVIAFGVMVVVQIIPCLGQLLGVVAIYAVQVLLMFGLCLIVDQKMDFWPASMLSIDVVKKNFWPFMGFGVVAMLVGSIGAVFCGIGSVITFPIQLTMLSCAYLAVFDRDVLAIDVEAAETTEVVDDDVADSENL